LLLLDESVSFILTDVDFLILVFICCSNEFILFLDNKVVRQDICWFCDCCCWEDKLNLFGDNQLANKGLLDCG